MTKTTKIGCLVGMFMILTSIMFIAIMKIMDRNDIRQVNTMMEEIPFIREILKQQELEQQRLEKKRELQEWWGRFLKKHPKAKPYIAYINWAGEKFDVDPRVIASVIVIESNWDPNAISKKGAEGLMQLMLATAREIQPIMNPKNPYDCIWLGTFYLRKLIDTFGSLEAALAAYNMGPGNFQKFLGKNLDPDTYFYVMRFKESIQSFA